MAELIEKEQIDCDFWLGESFETCIDQEAANKKLRSYQEFKDDGGPLKGVVKLTTNVDEAKRVSLFWICSPTINNIKCAHGAKLLLFVNG